MCALKSLENVAEALPREMVTEMIVPTLVKACTDRVPNVQFCVAKIIKAVKPHIDPTVL